MLSRRAALTIGASAAAFAGTVRLASAEGPTPELLTAWAEAWSAVNEPDKLLALVTSDVIYEDVAVGDVVKGAEALRDLLAEAANAIPDFRIELFGGLANDNMAAAEYAISGTQTGDLPYLKSSGRAFRIRAASIFVLTDGKIARESRYYDMARFLEALGGLSEADLPKLGTPPETPGG